jgi:hypothetical protein
VLPSPLSLAARQAALRHGLLQPQAAASLLPLGRPLGKCDSLPVRCGRLQHWAVHNHSALLARAAAKSCAPHTPADTPHGLEACTCPVQGQYPSTHYLDLLLLAGVLALGLHRMSFNTTRKWVRSFQTASNSVCAVPSYRGRLNLHENLSALTSWALEGLVFERVPSVGFSWEGTDVLEGAVTTVGSRLGRFNEDMGFGSWVHHGQHTSSQACLRVRVDHVKACSCRPASVPQ